MTRVVVCGGGAVGHALAGVLGALSANQVCVLTRRPFEWSNCVLVAHGDAVLAGAVAPTGDPSCVQDADVVLVATPAFAHHAVLDLVARHVRPEVWVGALPIVGRFDEAVCARLPTHRRVFGSLRSPYNARVARYGRRVVVTGIAPRLDLLTEEDGAVPSLAGLLEGLPTIPTLAAGPLLLAAASPAGTVFHAARMYELLSSPDPMGERFYGAWGAGAACAYLQMDAELAELRAALGCAVPGLDAASYYGTVDPDALARRIRSLGGLPDIPTPFREGGLDPAHRFVREDLPFGLDEARRLADRAGVPTPMIDHVRHALVNAAGTTEKAGA